MEVRSPQRKEHSPLHVRVDSCPRPQTLFSSTTQDGKAGPCVLSNQDTSRRPQGTCEVSTFAISAPKGPGRFTGTSGRPRPSWTFLLEGRIFTIWFWPCSMQDLIPNQG
ncbi:unnamed protein product [Rangifer tarandus platyrhynchus]|uniref:Uncharacterized protein n=1 Tax=Rangifer tarandus platyrhynchus TaxID=3082113 RepID=A0AC59Z7H7_RANTA